MTIRDLYARVFWGDADEGIMAVGDDTVMAEMIFGRVEVLEDEIATFESLCALQKEEIRRLSSPPAQVIEIPGVGSAEEVNKP